MVDMSRDAKNRSDPDSAANRNSCILMLVIYVVLTVIYTLVLQTRVEAAALPLAMGMAIFGTLFVASLISAVVWPGEVRWLLAAMRGEMLEQGELGAVSGRLVGEARPAPISDEPALAWSVDAYAMHYSSAQKRSRKILKVKGMGRVPMVIEGAAGYVHVGGLIELDPRSETSWKAEEVMSEVSALRARDVAKPFDMGLESPVAALDDFANQGSEYEMVRFDPTHHVMSDDKVEERLLKPGQEVCALGIFNSRTNTLNGRRILGVDRVQVFLGGPRRVAVRFMRKTLLGLAAMTFLFLLSHGLVGALLFLW